MVLKIISLNCLKTSGTKYRVAQLHIPEERVLEVKCRSGAHINRKVSDALLIKQTVDQVNTK
jgi:hypothetical protein